MIQKAPFLDLKSQIEPLRTTVDEATHASFEASGYLVGGSAIKGVGAAGLRRGTLPVSEHSRYTLVSTEIDGVVDGPHCAGHGHRRGMTQPHAEG